jgi:hypothetical protein
MTGTGHPLVTAEKARPPQEAPPLDKVDQIKAGTTDPTLAVNAALIPEGGN